MTPKHSTQADWENVLDNFNRRRPVMLPKLWSQNDIDPSSWFARERLASLRLLILSSDDLRFQRSIAANILSEAHDMELFMRDESSRGATEEDRLRQINLLEHLTALIGYFSETDRRTIRFLSENGARDMVSEHFAELCKIDVPVTEFAESSEQIRAASQAGKVTGIFHGSFDPPSFIHLSIANFCHQYCDSLVIGIDNDKLMKSRKGYNRPEVDFDVRYSIWSSFENVVDHVVEVPHTIIEDGEYESGVISEYYESMGINIVFLSRNEPDYDRRIKQIRDAGALPFEADVYGGQMKFRSTLLRELRREQGMAFLSRLWWVKKFQNK